MDIGTVLNTMRDPAGVPAHPVLFQALMVITWVLHIAFVHLTLGCAGLSIYAFHRRGGGAHWQRLSLALTQVAKVGVSLLIVLGVAPLLFTQVIYDPQWYASNVLSGAWAIGFIFTLIVAYCSWFAFYYANQPGARQHAGVFAWLALMLFLLDGLIMHALSYQALLPGQWLDWYAPGGVVDTRGQALHAIQWPRYLFMIGLSLPAVGVFLLAYAQYCAVRTDIDAGYLAFARALGRRLAAAGYAISLALLVAWQWVQPAGAGLALHPLALLLGASLLAMTLWLRGRAPTAHGYRPLLGGLGVLALLAGWRADPHPSPAPVRLRNRHLSRARRLAVDSAVFRHLHRRRRPGRRLLSSPAVPRRAHGGSVHRRSPSVAPGQRGGGRAGAVDCRVLRLRHRHLGSQ
jgi:hypothetical protein